MEKRLYKDINIIFIQFFINSLLLSQKQQKQNI